MLSSCSVRGGVQTVCGSPLGRRCVSELCEVAERHRAHGRTRESRADQIRSDSREKFLLRAGQSDWSPGWGRRHASRCPDHRAHWSPTRAPENFCKRKQTHPEVCAAAGSLYVPSCCSTSQWFSSLIRFLFKVVFFFCFFKLLFKKSRLETQSES